MTQGLWERLTTEEFTPVDAAKSLDYASHHEIGRGIFHFNVFDLVIDLDSQTATVIDILEPASSETLSLDQFVSWAKSRSTLAEG